ncbi:MAG: phenylalanine--tRNA ligase subunit beta [Treponema sp.]|jgi:phenylalanyl-tRNA synthetase beta chain|nr:phenylalanine--tRNA ligase subunit beta [Treponema sp.]
MPKIEVNEEAFYGLADPKGRGGAWRADRGAFEEALTCAKAELDEDAAPDVPDAERVLKIELNDTNRPDLWGTAGCARQLRIYQGGGIPAYPFFSTPGKALAARHQVIVEDTVRKVRPFLAGFVAAGKGITDAGLRDMIQTQEKLAGNFGRKRRTISMGLYRIAIIKWPIHYKAVDPDSVSFVPLQWDVPLTLREILKQHPKGKEYGFIQEHEPLHPLLVDAAGGVLSYPPIINSADLGAVQVGDSDLFVEITGTDMPSVTLAASIMACDLADQGFSIEPVRVDYAYDTPFGRSVVNPLYFQEPVFCSLARIEKFLGEKIDVDAALAALARMGVRAEPARGEENGAGALSIKSDGPVEGVLARPPEYRNDFLHAADVAEDVMMGRGLASFAPERPKDFTLGRLSALTLLSRRVKSLMVGLGYQEMIYNYLGSRKDLVEKMRGGGERILRVSNPMTENYEYVRDSILASLMGTEAVSGGAAYPHKIFETGKVAFKDASDPSGARTRQYLGFLHSGADANFNTVAAEMQTLCYYLSKEYQVTESDDPRFIPGRAAAVILDGKPAGVFGELHPEVLANWGSTVPAAAAELDLERLLG